MNAKNSRNVTCNRNVMPDTRPMGIDQRICLSLTPKPQDRKRTSLQGLRGELALPESAD
jgi:hypothetical protein